MIYFGEQVDKEPMLSKAQYNKIRKCDREPHG